MTHISYIRLDTADSTNSRLAAMTEAPHATVLCAREQTAGRGQRGNTWEAEPGRNLTLSMLLRPDSLEAHSQFAVSEAVALGVALTLDRYLGADTPTAIKWPNDIYVGDRKICGILIENTLAGRRIERSIAGIGLNVNQKRFVSDAPNPVSMAQIAGHEFPLDQVMTTLCSEIAALFDRHIASGCLESLHELYIARLWRREGLHPYRDTATGERFLAAIDSIGPMGHLTLRDASGSLRTFAFKEVKSEIDTLLL